MILFNGFLILATFGTFASGLARPTAIIITGVSELGRSSRLFKNFIGFGVWVKAASPAWCSAEMRKPVAMPTLSGTWKFFYLVPSSKRPTAAQKPRSTKAQRSNVACPRRFRDVRVLSSIQRHLHPHTFFSLFFCSNLYLMFNFRVWNCNKMPRLMVGARRRSTGWADTALYNGFGNELAVKISDTMATLHAVIVNLSFAQPLLVTAWLVTRKIKCLIGDFFPVKTLSPPARIMAVIRIVNWATTPHNRKLQLSWKLNPKNATNKSAARSWLKTLKSSWRYPHDMSFINKQLESHIRWFEKC